MAATDQPYPGYKNTMSIGQRIGAIIVSALLAIAVIIGASVYERRAVNAVEQRVRAATAVQIAAQGLDKRFIALQQSAERLISANEPALAESLPRDWQAIATNLGAIRQHIEMPDIVVLFDDLAGTAAPLGKINDRLIETRRAVGFDNASGRRGALLDAGRAFQNKLEEIRSKAIGMTFDTANQLSIMMLQMRGFEFEYALSGDRARFEADLDKASEEFLGTLRTAQFFDTVKQEIRSLHAAYIEAARAYASASEQLRAAEAEAAAIRQALAPKLAALVERARATEAAERSAAESTRAQVIVVSGGITGLIVLVILIASVIVARGILRPVRRMTEAMKALAEGNLDVASPDAGRQDEIGAMARAYEVFREHEIERREMAGAEQQRERAHLAEQTAQRRREAAMAAEIAALTRAISAGDLDRRLNLDDKEGDFREVSLSINQLTDTLQAVIGELSMVLLALSEGEVGRTMRGEYRGVFAGLKRSANDLAQRLAEFAGRLGASTNVVRNASAEISDGAEDLARRTESQAATLEETAAAMQQITVTVRQNAGNAQEADRLATTARSNAERGGKVVGDVVAAMERIEESARRIADIMGLIDEIAFQTNLLALNASVEAARAGEAGRGFAVVAQEVRALALRSANASKDIKSLIQTSNGQVKAGSQLAHEAGDSLGDIVQSIRRVSTIVAEIAAASSEQARGLDQVNDAVTGMDELTQRNSALVEETHASAQALANQAGELADLVGFFRNSAPQPAVSLADAGLAAAAE